MRGTLNTTEINRFLRDKADTLSANFSAGTEFTYIEIRDMLSGLAEKMVTAAMADPNTVAHKLLTEGGEDWDGVWHDATYWGTHKIQGIKQVRVLTGCGLKEAKDAYEQEHPKYLKVAAERALRDLEDANRRAGYRNSVKVDAAEFRNSLDTRAF